MTNPEELDVEFSPEEVAALKELLKGRGHDLAGIAGVLGLNRVALAQETVRYALSPGYAGDFLQVLAVLELSADEVFAAAEKMPFDGTVQDWRPALRAKGVITPPPLPPTRQGSEVVPEDSTRAALSGTGERGLPQTDTLSARALWLSAVPAPAGAAGLRTNKRKRWLLWSIPAVVLGGIAACFLVVLPATLLSLQYRGKVAVKENVVGPDGEHADPGVKKQNSRAAIKNTKSSLCKVVIRSVPAAAAITLNGESKGSTSASLVLAPGTYELTLTKKGFVTIKRQIKITRNDAGQPQDFIFTLPTANTNPPDQDTAPAEIIVTRYPAPAHAEAALQFAPGYGYGAVSIVLDFSGSMNEPLGPGQKEKKIESVKNALTQVLKGIPAGTHLSLLVFGRESEVPQLNWIRASKVWTGEAAEQTELLTKTFALPPKHTSPIVEAISKARREGFPRGFTGPRVLLALTDGDDTEFAKKPELHRLHNTANIPLWLKREFAGSGIEVNVAFFSTNKTEIDNASGQFRIFQELEPPGRFTNVRQAADLARMLEEALGPRMRLSHNGNLVKLKLFRNGQPVMLSYRGLPATMPAEDLLWGRVDLSDPDGQVFQASVRSLPKFQLHLRPGERMLLRVYRDAIDEYIVERALFANLSRKFEPASQTRIANRDWLAAVLQNKIWNQQGKLEQIITVEHKQNRHLGNNILEHVRPGFFWMEVTRANEKTPLAQMHWNMEYGYPAPAFHLEASKFTVNDTPRLSAWWIDEAYPDEASGGYAFGYKQVVGAVGGKALFVGDAAVNVEKVKKESRLVTVGPGQRKERSCLVVELKYTPGPPRVWVQPLGFIYHGEEHHYNTKAGRYTAIFWSDQELAEPVRLNLISLAYFKSKARFSAQWDLPAPDPFDQGPSINRLRN
jgi:hypothetical protein